MTNTWFDPYVEAFKEGKAARVAGLPRARNPHTYAPAWECEMRHMVLRMFNSWDAGWVFGTRRPTEAPS